MLWPESPHTPVPLICESVCCSWDGKSLQWCGFEVQDSRPVWAEASASLARNPDRLVKAVLQEVQIYLVENLEDLKPALNILWDSMRDPILGSDTEWKPDSKIEHNDVSMFQLASSTVVLLIRTCKIGFPQELIDFCRQACSVLT